MTINKLSLTERDICTKFINPALEAAIWDLMHQIREQYYFTDGPVIVRGQSEKRGDRKFADYRLVLQIQHPVGGHRHHLRTHDNRGAMRRPAS